MIISNPITDTFASLRLLSLWPQHLKYKLDFLGMPADMYDTQGGN